MRSQRIYARFSAIGRLSVFCAHARTYIYLVHITHTHT